MTDPQVVKQCKAVAHMARKVADIFDALADIQGRPYAFLGLHSAMVMEALGNILNAMDAGMEDDEAWILPIFEEAARRYPHREAP